MKLVSYIDLSNVILNLNLDNIILGNTENAMLGNFDQY